MTANRSDGRRPARSRSVLWVILVASVGVVLLSIGGLAALLTLWREDGRPDRATGEATVPRAKGVNEPEVPKPLYTFAEFQKLVQGKTAAEVEAAVGKADGTRDQFDRDQFERVWVYTNRIRDPGNPTVLWSMLVVMTESGRVIELRRE